MPSRISVLLICGVVAIIAGLAGIGLRVLLGWWEGDWKTPASLGCMMGVAFFAACEHIRMRDKKKL